MTHYAPWISYGGTGPGCTTRPAVPSRLTRRAAPGPTPRAARPSTLAPRKGKHPHMTHN